MGSERVVWFVLLPCCARAMAGALLLAVAGAMAMVGPSPAAEVGICPTVVAANCGEARSGETCNTNRPGQWLDEKIEGTVVNMIIASGAAQAIYPRCKDESGNSITPATHLAALDRPERVTMGTITIMGMGSWHILIVLALGVLGFRLHAVRALKHTTRRRAAVRVQGLARGFRARRSRARCAAAARCIQGSWRGYTVRLAHTAAQLAHASAVRIQRSWRALAAYTHDCFTLYVAAVCIQAVWRRYQVLYLLPDAIYWPLTDGFLADYADLAYADDHEMDGHDRTSLRTLRRVLSRETRAIVRTQAIVRGFLVRALLRCFEPICSALRGAALSAVVRLKVLVGAACLDCVIFDRRTRESVSLGTLLKRYGKAKKAKSAKKQRARQRKAELHYGTVVEKGGVLFTMGDPDDDLEDDPPPGVSPTRGAAA